MNFFGPSRSTRPFAMASIRNAAASKPLYLALLGAPGSGKGTFAARIAPHFKLPAISTGDLVRAEIKANTPIGKQIKEINDRGQLVSDDIIIHMVVKRLQHEDVQKRQGFLLDGFPRRISQAQALEKHFLLNKVLNIDLREDILIKKITSRRVCEKCGRNYNIADINEGEYVMPPMLPNKPGICDNDGAQLVTRADDSEAIVRHRLVQYAQETHPLIDFYRRKKILLNWEVKKGLDDTPALLQYLEDSV